MFICIYLKLFFLKGQPLLLVSFDPQFPIGSDDQAAREMQEIYCLINISPLPPKKEKVPWSLILDAGFPGNLVGVILIRLCVSNKQKENRALLDPEYSKFILVVKWKTTESFHMKIETFYGTSLL